VALSDSLISYWKLDEASGNALDSHSTNDLTDNNTVGSAAGKINNARDFENSANEYFSHVSNAALQTGNIDFTFTGWINAESFPTIASIILMKRETLLGGGDLNGNLEYQVVLATTAGNTFLVISTGNGSGGSDDKFSTTVLSLSTWYFFCAWHDTGTGKIYIQVNNGTPEEATTITTPATASFDFQLNMRNDGVGGNFGYDGLIDEIGFWKRVLTSDERTDLYNGGSGRSYEYITAAGWGKLFSNSRNRLVVVQ